MGPRENRSRTTVSLRTKPTHESPNAATERRPRERWGRPPNANVDQVKRGREVFAQSLASRPLALGKNCEDLAAFIKGTLSEHELVNRLDRCEFY